MKSRRWILLVLTPILILVLVLGACAAPAKPVEAITLTADVYIPASHPMARSVDWWLDYLEEETNGQLKFDRFFGGALLSGPDTPAGLAKGVADMAMVSVGYVPALLPSMNVGHLPYYTTNPRAFSKALTGLYNSFPEIRENFKKANLHLILPLPTGTGYLCADRPVKSIEDMKDVRIRAYGYSTKALDLLGASPAAIAYGEVFTALQTGVVDGAIGNSGDISAPKWHEAAKHQVDIGWGCVITVLWCCNLDTWNSLPNDLKEVIDKSVPLFMDKVNENFDELGIKWLEDSIALGGDIYMWPDEEKVRAKQIVVDPMAASWIAEVPGQEALRQKVINRWRELLSKYEGEEPYLDLFDHMLKK